MKTVLLPVVLGLFVNLSFAASFTEESSATCSEPKSSESSKDQVAQSGCCSWHGV